jgi:hypothetical protein
MKGKKAVHKDFYLNPVALLYLAVTALTRVLIAGRGFGKSFILGIRIMVKVATLPRSTGLLLAATYTLILTKILLPIKSAWKFLGYEEGLDYVIGRKPPAGFKHPYQKPERYENVITFWNGTTIVFGSMDRPQLLRGASHDWVIVDEALLIKEDEYHQIVTPTKRPSHLMLKGKPGHLSEDFTSSMPYGNKGLWLLNKEIEAKNPDNSTFYIEGTSLDNIEVLGADTIRDWKRKMPTITFLIEVMNKRIKQLGSLFYPALTDDHFYNNSYEYSYIDNLGVDADKLAIQDSRWDKDCDPDAPISISHDHGAFNCITVSQHSRRPYYIDEDFTIPANTVRFINYMYVVHPRINTDMASDFCKYYKHQRKKVVYQYGDKSGNDRQRNSKDNAFEEFASVLRTNGWQVILMNTGDAGHLERHDFINKLHRAEDPNLVRVMYNANKCKDLRIALESTPMKDGEKDKRSERSKTIKPQHATHGTDAHDYQLWFGYNTKLDEGKYSSNILDLNR